MTRRVIAIDVGTRGAAALLSEDGELLEVEDLPVLDDGPACRPTISAALFADLVRRWAPSRAYVELIGPRLGDRPAGAFSFGRSRGTVDAVLATLQVPSKAMSPASWKRGAGIPAGRDKKDMARSVAIQRWPAHAGLFARVKDHDRAEAALIGLVGLQREVQDDRRKLR